MCLMICTSKFELTTKKQYMYSFSNSARKFQDSHEIYEYFEMAHSTPGRDWLSQFKAMIDPLIIVHIDLHRKQKW